MSARALRRFLVTVLLAVLPVPPALLADGDVNEGTIRKIDTAAGRVTIEHGPIDDLGMPPMTMVFVASDRAMLEALEPGDEVEFVAAEEDGRFFVTEIRRGR